MAQTKEIPSVEDMPRLTSWVRERVCSVTPADARQSLRLGPDPFLDADWGDVLSAALDEQVRRDERTIAVLRRQVRDLRGRIAELEDDLALQHELLEDADCLVLEMRTDVPVLIATREIEQYVLDHPGTDAYDISEDLRLPSDVVETVLADLVAKDILRTGG